MIRKLVYGCLFLSLSACQAADQESDVEGDQSASGVTVSSVTDGDYVIRSVATDHCFDVSGASTSNGAAVQEWSCNGTKAQVFHVASLGDGFVEITNVNSGKSLDVTGASREANAKLEQWTYGAEPHQQFKIVVRGDKQFSIHARHTDMALDLSWGSANDGTPILQYPYSGGKNQLWSFDKLGSTGGSSGNGGGTTPRNRIVGGYYPNWTEAPPRIRDVDPNYNLIYLFAATPVGGAPGTTGAVSWTPPGNGKGAATNLKADIEFARKSQGRKIILAVGGAGNGMSFPNRAKSQAFVDSIVGIYNQLGGFDGLDWNTFEGSQAPDTSEMIWMSLALKQRYPGFIITAPPAPWNPVDKAFCAEMVRAGALDYAAPQYYDGPNLAEQSYIVNSVDEWSTLLGASHVAVGFGVWNQPNYMTPAAAAATWNQLESKHPDLRGAFDWAINLDEGQGWSFARSVGPLIRE